MFFYSLVKLSTARRFKKNDSVLIHGGTSGIGLASIQIAKLFKPRFIQLLDLDIKKEFCKKIGIDIFLTIKKETLFKEIKKRRTQYDFRLYRW